MEPIQELSRFCYICAIVTAPVAGWVALMLKRRWERGNDGAEAASPEEIMEELDREFTPVRTTTIRTQTEYLPFLFECIRENIDSGFEDPQVISLLERIEHQRPDQERKATFTVVADKKASDLHLLWVRDSANRIRLNVQGAPRVIRALRDHKRRIPRAVA